MAGSFPRRMEAWHAGDSVVSECCPMRPARGVSLLIAALLCAGCGTAAKAGSSATTPAVSDTSSGGDGGPVDVRPESLG